MNEFFLNIFLDSLTFDYYFLHSVKPSVTDIPGITSMAFSSWIATITIGPLSENRNHKVIQILQKKNSLRCRLAYPDI